MKQPAGASWRLACHGYTVLIWVYCPPVGRTALSRRTFYSLRSFLPASLVSILRFCIIINMVSLLHLVAWSLASAGLIEGAALDASKDISLVARQCGGQQGGQTCLNKDLIQSASGLTG